MTVMDTYGKTFNDVAGAQGTFLTTYICFITLIIYTAGIKYASSYFILIFVVK